MKVITSKVNQVIGLLQKLRKTLLRLVLVTMYKAFLRPNLDYGDMINDEAYIKTFHQTLESIQYNAYLAVSEAIIGSSKQKLYHELGLKSLQRQHWYRKLCLFCNIFKENKHTYLFNPIPTKKYWIIIQEMLIKLLYFILNKTFSKIVFYHPLLLNGAS